MDSIFEWWKQFLNDQSEWVNILFSPQEDKIYIFKPQSNFLFIMYIDSMQKAVNDVIDIFISEDMENMSG